MMNLSFEEELSLLKDIIDFKEYQRYGNALYTKYINFKAECTIQEFVWNYCKNPCFAKGLISEIDDYIDDCNDFAKKLANGTNYDLDNTFSDSIQAFKQAMSLRDIQYSIEYDDKDIYIDNLVINNLDGDLFCGLLFTQKGLDCFDNITISLSGVNNAYLNVIQVFEFPHSKIMKNIEKIEDGYYSKFKPFKYPIILSDHNRINIKIDFKPNVNTSDIIDEWEVVFGLLPTTFRNWVNNTTLEFELCKKHYVAYKEGRYHFK